MALFSQNGLDSLVGRLLGSHVQFDDAQVHPVGLSVVELFARASCVATRNIAHAGVDDMPGLGQAMGRQLADAGCGTGDEDNVCLTHGKKILSSEKDGY